MAKIEVNIDKEEIIEEVVEQLSNLDVDNNDQDNMSIDEFDEKLVEINDSLNTLNHENDASVTYYMPEGGGGDRTVAFEFTEKPTSKDLAKIMNVFNITPSKINVVEDYDNYYDDKTSHVAFARLK